MIGVIMELPVAPQTYRPSAEQLVRAVKRSQRILARMVADETDLDGAVAFFCKEHPDVEQVNFAAEVHVHEDDQADVAGPLINRVLNHFQEQGGRCTAIYGAHVDWPAVLVQAITSQGFEARSRDVLMLTGYAPPTLNEQLQIIPGRASYAEMRKILGIQHKELKSDVPADAATEVAVGLLDEPRLDVFLGRLDRKPAGYVSVLSLGNIGVIRDVYVGPDFRDRGVGRTLISSALDHCRRALFEQVIIQTAGQDPRSRLLESLGFKVAATYEYYRASGR